MYACACVFPCVKRRSGENNSVYGYLDIYIKKQKNKTKKQLKIHLFAVAKTNIYIFATANKCIFSIHFFCQSVVVLV